VAGAIAAIAAATAVAAVAAVAATPGPEAAGHRAARNLDTEDLNFENLDMESSRRRADPRGA
jgi:hypothetical protein